MLSFQTYCLFNFCVVQTFNQRIQSISVFSDLTQLLCMQAKCLVSGSLVVLKIYCPMSHPQPQHWQPRQEISIHARIQHPGCIQMYAAFQVSCGEMIFSKTDLLYNILQTTKKGGHACAEFSNHHRYSRETSDNLRQLSSHKDMWTISACVCNSYLTKLHVQLSSRSLLLQIYWCQISVKRKGKSPDQGSAQ